MLINSNITVINVKKTRTENKYYKTVIRGVWWYGGILKSVTDGGMNNAETYRISIYEGLSHFHLPYCTPKEWEQLENPDTAWTLKPGDYICKGEVTEEIQKPSDFQSRYETAEIIGVKDLRYGNLPYWRVEGK
jgi:hypothetical protein